jgi:hypothetical protein
MATRMWRVDGPTLRPLDPSKLDREQRLEEWLERDPELLGLDLLLIGRQVRTDFGGIIDLLGINRSGDVVILELKRDRTPRDVVAQVLDYGSWACKLTPREIHDIADRYLAVRNLRLADAFRERFGSQIPENLNSIQSLVIVASELDDSSERIVQYLAEQHGLQINTAFFQVFCDGSTEYLVANWLMDQEEVRERSEARTKAPWTGAWYVNVDERTQFRSWEDCRRFGFVAAGHGRKYSDQLRKLNVGDRIYAYLPERGYVGSGTVTHAVVKAKDFRVDGKPLLELELRQPNLARDADDDKLAEYVVGVKWDRTFPESESKRFAGAFSNQHIVCKLRDETTLQFLRQHFG